MSDSRQSESPGGGPKQEGPPPESSQGPSPLDELNRLLEDFRIVGARLWTDVTDLVRAQWRLTSYVVAGTAKIWALRIWAHVLIGILGLTGWAFLNIALWRAVAELPVPAFVPPLAVASLNMLAGAAMHNWQKNLRLK